MKFIIPDSKSKVYNFNYGWKFLLADEFPLKRALDKHKDSAEKYFYELGYNEAEWKNISVPHTFNDCDMFVNRIEDAGTGQKRTFSFYRKTFYLPKEQNGKKVIIEFEGVRQTCYLYVNGRMAGFHENGVAPFAFDITAYVNYCGENLIAIATDNTSTRNMDSYAAETPNHPDAVPGAFIAQNTQGTPEEIERAKGSVSEEQKGVGFFWNCNDFNPSIGGLSKNIRLHIKHKAYLTLNLYSNLRTKGIYVYASDFDIEGKKAKINISAELRNETDEDITAYIESVIVNHLGEIIGIIKSEPMMIKKAVLPKIPPLTITPKDAYIFTDGVFKPVEDEALVAPTETASDEVTVVTSAQIITGLEFWSANMPYQYDVYTSLVVDGEVADVVKTTTGFRQIVYDNQTGLYINEERVWLTGYAQRSSNEWAAIGAAVDWLKDYDARLVRESNANHIRWMHVAACPADIRSCDRYGVVSTQPAGDKERENFGRQWDMRVELMRDILIYFRNSPSIIFWEAGNNSIGKEHMREMTLLKHALDPNGGRYMGCRTINIREVVEEAEWVGTMLNRHVGRFQSELMPVLETEYAREESPRRVWDDFSPPDFDYDNAWIGSGGKKQVGRDTHDFTAEEFAVITAHGYAEFFNDRMGGASGKNLYTAAAALCWTDSAQHGRQSASENARMSGRVDAVRIKKQNFYVYKAMQSGKPEIMVLGHWNYPKEDGVNYRYPLKAFENDCYIKTGKYAFRDPKNKTVYVVASYPIAKVELIVNGVSKGFCEKPINTFIYPFDNIDVTQAGDRSQSYVMAIGYDFDGNAAVQHRIETASEPAKIRLIPYTGGRGFLADGADQMYFDVEIVDDEGRVCPLCYDRIDFELNGQAVFLGGYNSGRFNGFGKNDSVIHQNHVYAECGTNRVFLRSKSVAGEITLKAKMNNLEAIATVYSTSVKTTALSEEAPQILESSPIINVPSNSFTFNTIAKADELKFTPDNKVLAGVVINGGHEIDTKGNRVEFMDGAVWGPILIILERIKGVLPPDMLRYDYDENERILTVESGGHIIKATFGHTHIIIDGQEVLMGGQPEIRRDMFWMELNHVIPYIKGIKAQYDNAVNIYRVETE